MTVLTSPAPIETPASPLRRAVWPLSLFGGMLVGVAVVAVGLGAVSISPGQVLSILGTKLGLSLPWAFESQQEVVLLGIRLPRVLLGMLVGAGLSVSGALMQGLFRNPLADPGLIGVSSGGALGAAVMIVLGPLVPVLALSALGSFMVAFGAFALSLATTLVVYRIATQNGRTSVATMLLAGIAVNALCGAGTGALVLLTDDSQLRDLTFWTLGSLGGATWSGLAVVALLVLPAICYAPVLARPLNAMLLGEAEARHLGIRTQRVKLQVVTLSALAVGAATAVAGIIGFVGLVVPHLVRLMIGPDHRVLLPGAVLLGAAMVPAADLLARVLLQPTEIPIGIVTAFTGAPFFLWLLLRERQSYELAL